MSLRNHGRGSRVTVRARSNVHVRVSVQLHGELEGIHRKAQAHRQEIAISQALIVGQHMSEARRITAVEGVGRGRGARTGNMEGGAAKKAVEYASIQ
eukprot:762026-Hanusia_phi.AAC.10